ncbi:mechanosensitive ion channel domain-containing protein [Brevundimonas sp.]|uniref:mechanosensitive ion channel family protein n=1 Tax=Brevundimonas sp. TaxID=1871086 RepID=UPI0028A0E07A|nr:mechanosensitive ion channel domain-containing protein [Brevundimonas sp.]
MQQYDALRARLADFPMAEMLAGLCLLVLVAVAADFIVRRGLTRILLKLVERASDELDSLLRPVVRNLSRVVPTLIVQLGIASVPHLHPSVVTVVQNVAAALTIVAVVLAIGSALDMANALYARSERAHRRNIKGYVQVVKLVVYAIGTILVIASLIDRSPLLLLSGLGALAAVLMLVFKDTILSLVASVQLNSNDMLRVGDWIEMPQLNADGDVIDIALHTVKVQNWDKTITTIPTWRLINESYKNWRGMQESGGRRIKRSLLIDQNSVRFLSEDERNHMRRIMLIDDYLAEKSDELARWNAQLVESGRDPVNTRRATNLGTFRAYVKQYLKNHTRLNPQMTQLVRQMAPDESGLPLEIYCFTATTAWADYEDIQADIFDHLLAILPEFGLRLAQQPTGADMAAVVKAVAGQTA